jgi:hypothetical protein
MIEVKIKPERYNTEIADITAWLRENVGKGSERFRKNTWMGTDDWFCYTEYARTQDDEEGEATGLIFVFRREQDATMFSLRWS